MQHTNVRAHICIRYYSRKSIGIKITEFLKAERDFDVWKMKRLEIHDGIIVTVRKSHEKLFLSEWYVEKRRMDLKNKFREKYV